MKKRKQISDQINQNIEAKLFNLLKEVNGNLYGFDVLYGKLSNQIGWLLYRGLQDL